MNEARVTGPLILRPRLGKGEVPPEIRVLPLDGVEVLDVKRLAQAAGAVPEGDPAVRPQAPELIEDVRPHGRHAGAAAHKEHLGVGLLREELAERPRDRHPIARLEAEQVRRHLARRHVLGCPRRRRRDPDVQHDEALLIWIVRHRVRARHRLLDRRDVPRHVERIPVAAVLGLNDEVGVADHVRRADHLDVAARPERHRLALGQLKHQLLDEGGHIVIRADGAWPFADREDLGGHLDPHVVLDLDLAGQPHAFAHLAPREMVALGRQDRAAAREDPGRADAARSLAAAGRRNEDAVDGERAEQRAAGRRPDRLRRVVVDDDLHLAGSHQLAARHEQQAHERQDDAREQTHAHQDRGHDPRTYNWMPANAMNPIAMRPVTMKVMPRPRRPSGTLL